MSEKLKPRPFCGGEAEIWRANCERTAWIGCMGRCSVLVSKEYKTDAEAITAWNTRADTDRIAALEAEVERLREDAKSLIECEPVAFCERCEAWLLASDDFVASPDGDIHGCWQVMTDSKTGHTKPCYSYRTRAALQENPDAR